MKQGVLTAHVCMSATTIPSTYDHCHLATALVLELAKFKHDPSN